MSARATWATGLSLVYNSQSSKRGGRWNQIAWSRLAEAGFPALPDFLLRRAGDDLFPEISDAGQLIYIAHLFADLGERSFAPKHVDADALEILGRGCAGDPRQGVCAQLGGLRLRMAAVAHNLLRRC